MKKETWKKKKLEDCFEFIRNGANIKQDSNADGIPITRIETLSNNKFNRDKLGYANIFEIEKFEKYLLQDKDILMSHINSVKFLGRAVLYSKEKEEIIIHGMNLLNLRAIQQIFNPQFAVYYFQSFDFKDKISKITKKAVNQASFTVSTLKDFLIPVPPLAIQEQIVEELDTLSNIIDKKKKQLQELDTLAQATFYDMFGDPVNNEKGWEEKKLEDIITLLTDYHANDSYEILRNNVTLLTSPNYALMVRTTDLENGNFNDACIYIDEKAYNYLDKTKVHGGEIIMNKIGSAGKVYLMPVLDKPVSLGMNAFLIRTDINKIKNIYLFYYLTSPYGAIIINKRVKGAVTKTITKDAVRNLPLILPPLPLQNQFAERIEAIEKQKELISQSIQETEMLFSYTMDKYFN